jgi:cytochrome oxidase assembly protein ShyY1
MLRPRWIGLLALCLVVAGIFSWLLQWQLTRALATSPVAEGQTEQVVPLDDIVAPGGYLDGPYVGQRVDVTGSWDPENFLVVAHRVNDDAEGYWVTGRLEVNGASLATAIGWAATEEDADEAIAVLSRSATDDEIELTGRIIASEDPSAPGRADPHEIGAMSSAALLAHWDVEGEVYRPYLVVNDATGGIADAGLETISSPAPEPDSNVNLLNLFYAVEWAIFAGFSFYLWYRLAKDAWERELEAFAGVDPDADDDDD